MNVALRTRMRGLQSIEAELRGDAQPARHPLGSVEIPKGIYGITSNQFGHTHSQSAAMYLDAGVRMIQYREKHAPESVMVSEALEIRSLCREYGATFIVNDHVRVAIASHADGVHLGQDDMSIHLARRDFGGMIGLSATTEAEAVAARDAGAAYLGVGSMFFTMTKPDAKLVPHDEFRKIRERIRSIPVFAIGGIGGGSGLERIDDVKRLGADGIAVISSVLATENPQETARRMIAKWSQPDPR